MDEKELKEKIKNELVGVELKKIIPSTTRVQAVHLKINGTNYQVTVSPLPRLWTETAAYEATRTGRVLDFTKSFFKFQGDDIFEGIKELSNCLNGLPFKNENNTKPLLDFKLK